MSVTPGHPVKQGAGYDCACGACLGESAARSCSPTMGCGDCADCARWKWERDERDRTDDPIIEPVGGWERIGEP